MTKEEELKTKKGPRHMSEATVKKYDKVPIFEGFVYRFPRAIDAVSLVSQWGTHKHQVPLDDISYLTIPNAKSVYTNALLRHLLAEAQGFEHNLSDGGLLHAAQVAWNAMARLECLLEERAEEEMES